MHSYTKMANDPQYKEDQTAFRNWIGRAEDALCELLDKLEETGMDLPIASSQAPPVSSDINAILLQISKQQEGCPKANVKTARGCPKANVKTARGYP